MAIPEQEGEATQQHMVREGRSIWFAVRGGKLRHGYALDFPRLADDGAPSSVTLLASDLVANPLRRARAPTPAIDAMDNTAP